MLLTNPHAVRCAYPAPLRELLNIDKAAESRRWLRCWQMGNSIMTAVRGSFSISSAKISWDRQNMRHLPLAMMLYQFVI